MTDRQLILASNSPRRVQLLGQLHVSFKQQPVDVDESPLGGEAPAAYVERLAQAKAEAGWCQAGGPAALVIGSDTCIAIDDLILGKPVDQADGWRMLRLLSGRCHQVFSAVAVMGCKTADGEPITESRVSISEVCLRPLSESEVRTYWATGEPQDKAGAYAIQGRAAQYVRQLNGSYSAVMGLPLFETAELLRGYGVDCLPGNPEPSR